MFQTLLYATLGLALILTLRRLAQRLFGAELAFALWLMFPLLVLLPRLPALPLEWAIAPKLLVLPAASASIVQAGATVSTMHWPLLLWIAGTMLCLVRLAIHYCQLRRRSQPLPYTMRRILQATPDAPDPCLVRLHPAGPAVLWAPRSLLLIPADFLERFDADEQRLVLQHELTHLRRGDALWSLLAELTFALLWFHPLAWLARPRFRLDQELACDECVLRRSPQDEAKYARTLLHSTGISATPALIPWLDPPQMKERLQMIQYHRPGALHRRLGFITLTALIAGSAFGIQAIAQQASPPPPPPPMLAPSAPSQNPGLSSDVRIRPSYPESAIRQHEQGTVALLILVHADGSVGDVRYDSVHSTTDSADLIAAATEAAQHWRLKPEVKNGKPVDGYARVPITFSLQEATPKSTR